MGTMVMMIEVDLEDRIVRVEEASLIRAQALWRGAVVRKHLSLVQTEYLRVLEEIEPDAQVKVTWNIATVSLPVFARSQTPGVSVVVKQKTTKTNREPKSGPAESEGQSVHRISHQRTNSGVIDDSDPRQTGSPVDQASLGMAPNVPRESSSEHLGLGETNPSGENIPLLENGSKQWNIALGEQMVVCSAVPRESDKKDFTPANLETSQDDIQVKPNGVELNNGLKLSAENDKFEPPSVTGVWDSMDISQGLPVTQLADGKMKVDREALMEERNMVVMELLWIQQAIDSRKQYLRLRNQMVDGACPR